MERNGTNIGWKLPNAKCECQWGRTGRDEAAAAGWSGSGSGGGVNYTWSGPGLNYKRWFGMN